MRVPIEVIQPIIDNQSMTWQQKFAKIIAYKKSCGLRGFNATFYSEDGKGIDQEKMAHDLCITELEFSKGNYRDITGEDL